MATATLISYLTDVELGDNLTPTLLSGGQGGSNVETNSTEQKIQGSGCPGCGMTGGAAANPGTSLAWSNMNGCYGSVANVAGANKHLHLWLRCLYPVHAKQHAGIGVFLGNGGENNAGIFSIGGYDTGYGGEWKHVVIDVDSASMPNPDVSNGTFSKTTIDTIGIGVNITVSLGESYIHNTYFDAIRSTDGSGRDGYAFHGGLTGDRLNLTNVAAADTKSHGASNAGTAYGILNDLGGNVYQLDGELYVGASGFTTWLDHSNATIFCADLPVSADYYNLIFQTGGASDTHGLLAGLSLSGVSRAKPIGIDATALTATEEGNLDDMSLAYGRIIKLGPYCSGNNMILTECQELQLLGRAITNLTNNNNDKITLNTAGDEIDGGITNGHNTATGVGFIDTNDLSRVKNHTFNKDASSGHAITLTAGVNVTLTGCTFNGYSTTVNDEKAIRYTHANNITITIAGGGNLQENLIYSAPGAGTVTVVNSLSITITGIVAGSVVSVYETGTSTLVDETLNSGTSFNFGVGSGVGVDIVILKATEDTNDGYIPIRLENRSFTSDQTVSVDHLIEGNFKG